MAVSTSSYFSNAIVGVPQQGADIDLYQSDLTPKFAVGFGFTRADGNKYRYGHFGAATTRGAVVATDYSESSKAVTLKAGTIASRNTTIRGETMKANAIGSRFMQLTITASASQFAGGYVTIHSGTAYGYTYHIKDNDATSAYVTSDTFLELYDPIQVAIDSNSEVAIVGCPYANLEAASTTDPLPAGVTVTSNSASSYGWIQTHGPSGVLQDATIGLIGKNAFLSTNTSGACSTVTGTLGSVGALNVSQIGYYLSAGTSAAYAVVYLTIE